MLSHTPNQDNGPTLILDADQSLLASAFLEAVGLLDQHQALSPLPPQARDLVRRARLRLSYFFRHSHAAGHLTSFELRLVREHSPELEQSLSRAPARAHSLHQEAPDQET